MNHREKPPSAVIYFLDEGIADIEMVLPNGETKRGYCGKVEIKDSIANFSIVIDLMDEVEER